MHKYHFFKLLAYTILISLVIIGCMFLIPPLKVHTIFTVGVVTMFSLLGILNFFVGEQLAKSSNYFLYNNLIIINFLLKIVLSFAIVLLYVNWQHPSDNWYLTSFVVIYILFTSFEVLFMTKQAKIER